MGVAWLVVLLKMGSPAAFWLGTWALIALAVPVCSRAERILGRSDPGSVVLDEVAAVPLTFAGLLLEAPGNPTRWAGYWPGLVVAFAAFRLFDIWKPWPIRASQRLPGGWGVVLDDVLAALAAAVVTWGFTRWHGGPA